jgi:TrmH family RNA methyltransferase
VRDRRPGEVIADGRRLVADLVPRQLPIRELYIAHGVDIEPATLAAAESCWELEPALFSGVAPTRNPQGVLAVVDEPRYRSWTGGDGVAVYLEGVQDPGNLGAVIRCVAAIGGSAVVLSPGCADPFHWATLRASAGAVMRVPVVGQTHPAEAAASIRKSGGEVWAATTDGDPMTDWRPARPTLLALGAEGAGLSAGVLALADGAVGVALDRGIDSLNVAVTAGILLQHLRSPGSSS